MASVNDLSNKTEHLNMIEAVINRLANNALQIKCWTVAIATAFIALTDELATLIALIPIMLLCLLDAKYLSTERSYRGLYNDVRTKDESDIDYLMDADSFKEKIYRSIISWSVIPFYTTLALAVISVTIIKVV